MLKLNQQRLNTELDNWQAMGLTSRPTVVKKFNAGLNHQTYLIKDGFKQAVLKLFASPQPTAIKIQHKAATIDVASHVLYSNSNNNVALFEYIDGAVFSPAVKRIQFAQLAHALKKLHSLPGDEYSQGFGQFDVNQVCHFYLNQLNKNQHSALKIHGQIMPILDFFMADKSAYCLCHNDLVADNCIGLTDKVLFIDWEYAQINNPWFDLAQLIYYLHLDKEASELFLQHYFSIKDISAKESFPQTKVKSTQSNSQITDAKIFIAAQCTILWVDILWYLSRNNKLELGSISSKLTDLSLLAAAVDITIDANQQWQP